MNRNTTMKPVIALSLSLLAMASLLMPTLGKADDQSAATVDTSKWKCKFCQFEDGHSGVLELGPGYVSDDSFKFGEYTGLNRQGGFLLGNATARYRRSEDAAYLNLSVTDVGLDSRSLSVDGGKQGKYKLFLKYDEIPHYLSNTATTPFLGTGTASLTLPAGWVQGSTTGAMTALAASLHGVDLETQRKRFDIGAALLPVTHWEYAVRFRHETKDGERATAGTFIFNSTQLIQPIDYSTDQVDVSAAYNGQKWQAKLAYYGSTFHNGDAALTWHNPYISLNSPAQGQLALPPSNQFHQIVLSSGYQFTERTRAMGEIAIGRMQQDEGFLPVTLNGSLPATQPLPRSSLDGQVDTVTAHLKVTSAPIDKLRLNAAYTYNDRNNKTPQSAYDWVTTDTSTNGLLSTNQPYSFTRSLLNLSADYRLPKQTKLGAGFDYDVYKRSLQDIDKTRENTLWGKVSANVGDTASLMFKYAHGERNVSAYQPNPAVNPPENPLLRKYNMADRTRDTLGFHSDITPLERVTVGVGADFSWDNYSKSMVGLLDDRDSNLSGDVSVILTDKTSLTVFLDHQQIKSNQAGSTTQSTADWFARNRDRIDTAGIGVKYRANTKLDVGADYTLSQSRGEISVTGGTPGFPDLVTHRDSVKLYGNYRLKENISLRAAYWYERYYSEDWSLDGVTPSTIPNVLTLGQLSPSYHINVVTLSVRYSF